MSDRNSGYQLGSADDELARLELQGRALSPATYMIFDAAGIRPGMRVLDLGCGVGDVAFVAADLVGPDGYVVGVDRSPEALAPIGPQLWTIVQEAGLRPLGMIGIQLHFGPEDPAAVALLAGVIRTAAPLIERTGVATAEEIGVETYAQRLKDELQRNPAVHAHPILLSAWARTGGA